MSQHALGQSRSRRSLVLAMVAVVLAVSAGSASVPDQSSANVQSQMTGVPLNIGGGVFRLGMTRQQAMAVIAECCRTDGTTDAMFIHNKQSDFIIGAIFFKNDRVSGLRRDEKQSTDKAAADVVLSLYRALFDITQQSATAAVVSATAEEGSNFSGHNITFAFPNGRIVSVRHSVLDNGSVVVGLSEER